MTAPFSVYPTSRVATQGGIRAAWVTSRRYISRVLFADGVVDRGDYTLVRWWPFATTPIAGTMTAEASGLPVPGCRVRLNLTANQVRAERRSLAERLRKAGKLSVLILDNNGLFWLAGWDAGLAATASLDWGERGAANRVVFEVAGRQGELPLAVPPDIAQDWLAGDAGTYTPTAADLARLTSADYGAPAVTPLCLPLIQGGTIVCPPSTGGGGRVYEAVVSNVASLTVTQSSHELSLVGAVTALETGGAYSVVSYAVDSSETVTLTFTPNFTGKIRISGQS